LANTKSAEKRIRQGIRRNTRNRMVKSGVKTAVKKILSAVEANDSENAKALLKKAIPVIDKAAAKRVFHKNTASRKISRITRRINALLNRQKEAAVKS